MTCRIKYIREIYSEEINVPGDVSVTFADSNTLEKDFGIKPNDNIRDGLRKFAE